MDDHQLAAWLARRAGELLVPLRDGPLDGGAIGLVGDQTANAFLMSSLKMLRPGDAILSEESPDDLARLAASRVWIIDPLDGTREYQEQRSDWAVHVALAVDGVPAAGAVAQPGIGRIFGTAAVQPRPAASAGRSCSSAARARRRIGGFGRHAGCGAALHGIRRCEGRGVIAGEADLYFHVGGQHEWDNCAPVAVALAAGLIACRIDGSPIRYNQADVKVPDLLIATPDIGRAALVALGAAGT
jgi:3'(2'), 5'-bisphosphate nucleotidase